MYHPFSVSMVFPEIDFKFLLWQPQSPNPYLVTFYFKAYAIINGSDFCGCRNIYFFRDTPNFMFQTKQQYWEMSWWRRCEIKSSMTNLRQLVKLYSIHNQSGKIFLMYLWCLFHIESNEHSFHIYWQVTGFKISRTCIIWW